MPGSWNDWQHYVDTSRNQQQYGNTSDWINGIFGGPYGWYKMASGGREQGLGGTYGEHHAVAYQDPSSFRNADEAARYNAAALDEQTFNAMTDEEIQQFENMDYGQRVAFLKKKKAAMAAGDVEGNKRKAEENRLAQEKAARDSATNDIIKRLTAFAQEMNMPVDELLRKDGYAQALNQATLAQAQGNAMNRGLGSGGISSLNADYASKKALLGYQMQRQQMGQQASRDAYGMINNQGIQAEDLRRYEQGLDLQLQGANNAAYNQKYMQGMNKESGMWGLAGGALGAYFGGAAGAQAGQQIGSSIGSQRYSSSNPYSSPGYQYPKGYGSGGMRSGGNY